MATQVRKDLALKLPELQNLIKRDPASYKEEFDMQKRRYENELEIFKLRPTVDSERFTDLVTFMSHVILCYKKECQHIPMDMLQVLEEHANTLHPDVRAKLLQACIHLRNKEMIDPIVLLKLSFKLMAVQDKTLRTTLSEFIFNDIKGINLNKTNEKTNKRVQALMYGLVDEDTSIVTRKAVLILCELYRRRIWTDQRTVNVLGAACASQNIKIAVIAINFFLGIEMKMNEDEDQEQQKATTKTKADVNKHEHSKKTKKRARLVEKQSERNRKLAREQEKKAAEATPLFPAIQLLHDPQGLAEKLFQRARSNNERFEVRLLIMNLVSRLIGCHKLVLLSFYSYLQRYLTSHQTDVTKVLAYLVQACHELVPPGDLLPAVKTIAHNFITERCSNEAITVGLNAVREIMGRSPPLLLEDGMEELVQDLVMYGKKQHKSVMVAAHGIINLVRASHPALLAKKDRGKFHNPNAAPVSFGEVPVTSGVAGVELLDAYERGEILITEDGEIMWKEDIDASDSENEGSDGGDGWVEVSDSDDEEDKDPDEAPDLVALEEQETGGDSDHDDDEEEEEEEEEDDEDEDEGDWVSVSSEGSNGEEEEEEEEWEFMDEEGDDAKPPAKKQKRDVRESAAAKRVLSAEDFELIRKLQEAHAERIRDPRYRSRRARQKREAEEQGDNTLTAAGADEDSDYDGDDAEFHRDSYHVTAADLGAGQKLDKANKIERMQTVLSGREDVKFQHEGHRGGLTNLEKKRKKNYVMVRKGKREVSGKLSLSNSASRWQKMHAKKILGRDKRKRRRT